MPARASDIKFLFLPKDYIRKKKCGCLETKINMMGSDFWITDVDGLCQYHKLENRREFARQHKILNAQNPNRPKKRKKS